jgi:hypothetical protein
MNIKHRQSCRICGNTHFKEVIDLGYQNLQGSFLKEGKGQTSLRKIPNKIVRCDVSKNENACGLVQTLNTIPPKIMYSNYWYESNISKTMRDHLKSVVDKALEFIPSPKRVLDIAMNDGTLLLNYNQNIELYGVDPSDITKKVKEKYPHIKIYNDLFPCQEMQKDNLNGTFDIITSIACFYDLDNPLDFCVNINKLLSNDGVWIFEMAYLVDIIDNLCYDTFCSEHLEHYHLAPVEYLLEQAGMRLVYAETNDINGGSVCCYAVKNNNFRYDNEQRSSALMSLRFKEFDMALDDDKVYEDFKNRIVAQKYELVKFVNEEIIKNKKTLHLYGASTKVNTLLGYCFGDDISKYIKYAAERSPEKYGAETLSGIKIVSEEESRSMKPDYYLVGPWHFKKEIVEREKDAINNGIKFIFPLPKFEVIG